jgi:small subunit ribosomal protein S6
MPFYEHVFLARQDLATAQVEAMTETFSRIIADGKGAVASHEYWGLRSLAYRIAKNRKAHYVMLSIEAPAPAIAEMERQVGLNEDIIRFMTVRIDALPTEPSAMMKRGDRERERSADGASRGDRPDRERGDRGDRGDRAPRGDRPDRAPRAY